MLRYLHTLVSSFVLLGLSVHLAVANDSEKSDSHKSGGTCDCEAPLLWVLNSRCAPKCNDLEAGFEKITYQRYDGTTCKFVNETRESFLAAQANLPTLLFSHGNTLEHDAAMKTCWRVYGRFKACPGPKLLVFWSWPADVVYNRPILRPIELARVNIKTKYVFAELQGYYIAKLTDMMSSAQPITLSGHSYGGVSVVCAAHFLAGGSLDCLTFPNGRPGVRSNLRVAVISGAMDRDSLYPGYRYGKALEAVDRFYTTYNDRDSTLKRWPTHSLRGQEALGYTGMCVARAGENAHKIRQDRLTDDVGRSHYMTPHLASYQMVNAICEVGFDSGANRWEGGSDTRGRLFPGAGEIEFERIMDSPASLIFPGLGL